MTELQEARLLQESMPIVTIYSDGGYRQELGYGGYGTIMTCGADSLFVYGGYGDVSNNTMELEAVLAGLRRLIVPCRVNVVSDSRYICDGLNEWMLGWANNNWRKSSGQPVANMAQWQELFSLAQIHIIRATWVKGHAGDVPNQVCDHLATIGMFQTANVPIPPHLINPKRL